MSRNYRDRVNEMESSSAETESQRQEIEKDLENKVVEHEAAVEKCQSLEARVSELEAEVKRLEDTLQETQGELAILHGLQQESQTSSVPRPLFEELESVYTECQGNISVLELSVNNPSCRC